MRRGWLAVPCALVALATGAARADVTVTVDRTVVHPGDRVRATSADCCYLSLYLVPERLVPGPVRCTVRRTDAICAPSSVGPPHRRGWRWVGRFFPHRPTFAFRIPAIPAGPYRPVIYCAPCYRGPRGSLIVGSQRLLVRGLAGG